MPAGAPRIAYGGISIESSTYGHIRARMEDFTILRGKEADDNAQFAFLKKRYPIVPFLPTLVATAVPGGPVVPAASRLLFPTGRQFQSFSLAS